MIETNLKILKPIILGQLETRLKGYFKEIPKAVKLTVVSSSQQTELINLDTNEILVLKNTDNDSLIKNLERFLKSKINCIIATVENKNINIVFYYVTPQGEKLTKSINF